MLKLRDVLYRADRDKTAVGQFNVSDLTGIKAVFEAARDLNLPVVVGLSEGERSFMGVYESAAVIRALREEYQHPIFLNADHTHSMAGAEQAVRAGYDSVVFDRSALPIADNIKETRAAVKLLKAINQDVVIEGEIGEIGTGSEIHEHAPHGLTLTRSEEALQFVSDTGVDVLAPSVGNMHGLLAEMVSGEARKHLHIDLIAQIRAAAGVPLTLHGGSGTDDADLAAAVRAGISQVHINTDLRVAWRHSLAEALERHPSELAPYRLLPAVVQAVRAVVEARLRLFGQSAKEVS